MRSLLKTVFAIFCISAQVQAVAQPDQAIAEIRKFQENLDHEFLDPKESPLDKKQIKKFTGHDFYPIDLSYRVEGTLSVTSDSPYFQMRTTTARLPNYRVYGMVTFTLKGKQFKVPVYQSEKLLGDPDYKNYLFFPFTDLTSGKETYGGGRYIDLRIPEGNTLIIDFNQAYNPYCAYNSKYSCPIVPEENQLDVEVKAGVRYTH